MIHSTFWHIVSTGCFYVLFSWAITVSDFRLLEIYKNLDLPFSTITFTVNSNADNHFYKYICLCQILCSTKQFFIKIHIKVLTKVFYIQTWFLCETLLLRFLRGTMVCIKKLLIETKQFFAVDYVKFIELHIVHIWRHVQSEQMK